MLSAWAVGSKRGMVVKWRGVCGVPSVTGDDFVRVQDHAGHLRPRGEFGGVTLRWRGEADAEQLFRIAGVGAVILALLREEFFQRGDLRGFWLAGERELVGAVETRVVGLRLTGEACGEESGGFDEFR